MSAWPIAVCLRHDREQERMSSRNDVPFVDTTALDAATAGLPAPLVTVDLDAFDANADDLVRRAAGRPDPGGEQVGALPFAAASGPRPARLRRGDGVCRPRGRVARAARLHGRLRRLPERGPGVAADLAADEHLRDEITRGRRQRRAGALPRRPRSGRRAASGSPWTSTARCASAGCTSACGVRRCAPPRMRWRSPGPPSTPGCGSPG